MQSVGVLDNQSGLIPGKTYYLKRNGNLSTTPEKVNNIAAIGTAEVVAGIAISATELLVKG